MDIIKGYSISVELKQKLFAFLDIQLEFVLQVSHFKFVSSRLDLAGSVSWDSFRDCCIINVFPVGDVHKLQIVYHENKQPRSQLCTLWDATRDITPLRNTVPCKFHALFPTTQKANKPIYDINWDGQLANFVDQD